MMAFQLLVCRNIELVMRSSSAGEEWHPMICRGEIFSATPLTGSIAAVV